MLSLSNNYAVKFEIEGPGQLVADEETFTNPRQIQWGTAPVLVKATTNTGEIKVRASVVWEGKHTPVSAELIIPVKEAPHKFIADDTEIKLSEQSYKQSGAIRNRQNTDYEKKIKELQQEVNRLKLKEVEKQQSDFE